MQTTRKESGGLICTSILPETQPELSTTRCQALRWAAFCAFGPPSQRQYPCRLCLFSLSVVCSFSAGYSVSLCHIMARASPVSSLIGHKVIGSRPPRSLSSYFHEWKGSICTKRQDDNTHHQQVLGSALSLLALFIDVSHFSLAVHYCKLHPHLQVVEEQRKSDKISICFSPYPEP